MTLDEMVSAARSNIGAGLKEVGNYTFSIEQLKDEISNLRSLLIMQYSEAGTLNKSYFSQKISGISLDVGIFPEDGVIESNNSVLVARIPKLAMTKDNSSILYMGPSDMSLNIKVYYSTNDLHTHKYSRTIKNRPYAYIDLAQNYEGNVTVYVMGLGPAAFSSITIRAIVDDPVKLMQSKGYYIDDEEFPAPLSVQALIIDQITAKYINYYKKYMRSNEFNDQTDKG